jgi:hypothetical protein
MNQNNKWICDGVPKDGTQPTTGKHDPVENDGELCIYCGLSKSAMFEANPKKTRWSLTGQNPTDIAILTKEQDKPKNWTIWVGGGVIAMIFGVTIAVMYPCFISQLFVKCPTEQENSSFTNLYIKTQKQAEEIRNKFIQAKDLQISRDSMSKEIESLNRIVSRLRNFKNEKCCQSTVSIYLKLETLMSNLRDDLSSMDAFITFEKLAGEAKKLADSSKKITELESAKVRFEEVIKGADKISKQSFLSQKTDDKIQEYRKEISKLNDKLNQERDALNLFKKSQELGERAIDLGRKAKTIDELKEVQNLLIESRDNLDKISRDSLMIIESDSLRQEYVSALSKVTDAMTKAPCQVAFWGKCQKLPLSLP